MPEFPAQIAGLLAAAAKLPASVDAVSGLTDEQLMGAQRELAGVGRHVDKSAALVAAEIAWRSRSDLGYAGLAQRTGARTPESLVQQLTGSCSRDALALVRVGAVMQEAESVQQAHLAGDEQSFIDGDAAAAAEPGGTGPATVEPGGAGTGTAWLAPVGSAVALGDLPIAAADAIRLGLGEPTDTVAVVQLTQAAQTLVADAARLNADQLLKHARALRDEIDEAGVAERERQRHEQRYVRVYKRRDGMIKGDFLLAPESGGAEVLATFEAVTSPRRGGPRFVDEQDQARAKRILDDPRTPEQQQADALVELIKLGVDADSGRIVGSRKPATRVLVTEANLMARRGVGHLEGHPDAISIETVERGICDAGAIPIIFDDDGQVLNLGRELRLFNAKQRIGLAARDGGCRFPQCERPPSWCEAHHVNQWQRDEGRTDIADGILLCRHHHMLVHNNAWRIHRDGARYLLIPPRERDPEQTPIDMPTKSAALLALQRCRAS